jgi:formiminotetrahydrofolate cyclodeaminase
MLTTKPLNQFLDELASSSPAPGGGSAAALSGALGAALTSMVCRLTIGKKKYADVQKEMDSALTRSEELRSFFFKLVEEDTEVFNSVMKAFAMPKDTEKQKNTRIAAIEEATEKATLVPLRVIELCREGLLLTKIAAEKGNINCISDTGVSALMLRAACAAAALNVRTNLSSLQNKPFVDNAKARMNRILKEVEDLTHGVLKTTEAQF